MFINVKTMKEFTEWELRHLGINTDLRELKKLGIYPIQHIAVADPIPFIECLQFRNESIVDDTFIRYQVPQVFTVGELSLNLHFLHVQMRQLFVEALGEIDYRCSRATQDITARNTEITAIDESLTKVAGGAAEELSLLREELLKSNVSDGRVLVETRQIAEVNREMQTELLALEITEDMTLEEAQEITLRIASAKPWLPWREAQKP